jgi:hypothetical protein
MRNKKLLIGRRPARSKSLRVLGGDRANRSFCQVISSHLMNVFTFWITELFGAKSLKLSS